MQTTADQLVTNCNISVTKMCEQKMNIRHFPLFSAFFFGNLKCSSFFYERFSQKRKNRMGIFRSHSVTNCNIYRLLI